MRVPRPLFHGFVQALVLLAAMGVYAAPGGGRVPILFDTDANNELDDQHALAYAVLNSDVFDVVGVTVNATRNGGPVQDHYDEALRVLKLCTVEEAIPLFAGANAGFEDIRGELGRWRFDGSDAVAFIVEEARKPRDQKLVLVPVGKVTNIALALAKAPDIRERVRIVWLGSNYPEPGEYNQVNDIPALNYILDQDVPFELVMVRYGKPSGSAAVLVTPADIDRNLKGKGPTSKPVTGRHGGTFTCFGDYSVSLFDKIDLHGDPPARSMFDMVAVAVIKNPTWGEDKEIPAPKLVDGKWVERPDNPRRVTIWENFDAGPMLEDFYRTIREPALPPGGP